MGLNLEETCIGVGCKAVILHNNTWKCPIGIGGTSEAEQKLEKTVPYSVHSTRFQLQ